MLKIEHCNLSLTAKVTYLHPQNMDKHEYCVLIEADCACCDKRVMELIYIDYSGNATPRTRIKPRHHEEWDIRKLTDTIDFDLKNYVYRPYVSEATERMAKDVANTCRISFKKRAA